MIKAALFDLDGTLQDSEVLWVKATGDYVRDFGVPLSHEDETRIVYGRSWRSIHEDVSALIPGPAKTFEEMADEVRVYFKKLFAVSDIAIPGSVALFRRLAKTMPVAIVSGSTRQDIGDAVESLGLGDAISFYLGCEDYGPGKPAPDCFLLGAKHAGVDPSECVVFEDSTAGVLAAKAAGMKAVALKLPGHPEQDVSAADMILTDLAGFDPSLF